MKLTVDVCRKIGKPNYGSEGASCSLSFDVSDDPAALSDAIRRAFAVCERSVADQLGDGQAEQPPARPGPPPSAPARNGYPARPSSNGYGNRNGHNGQQDQPPRDGRQLIAVAKRLGEQCGWDVWSHLVAWGKANNLPGRVADWSPADVRAGHAEIVAQVEQPAH